jgi:hypothetical protein
MVGLSSTSDTVELEPLLVAITTLMGLWSTDFLVGAKQCTLKEPLWLLQEDNPTMPELHCDQSYQQNWKIVVKRLIPRWKNQILLWFYQIVKCEFCGNGMLKEKIRIVCNCCYYHESWSFWDHDCETSVWRRRFNFLAFLYLTKGEKEPGSLIINLYSSLLNQIKCFTILFFYYKIN